MNRKVYLPFSPVVFYFRVVDLAQILEKPHLNSQQRKLRKRQEPLVCVIPYTLICNSYQRSSFLLYYRLKTIQLPFSLRDSHSKHLSPNLAFLISNIQIYFFLPVRDLFLVFVFWIAGILIYRLFHQRNLFSDFTDSGVKFCLFCSSVCSSPIFDIRFGDF